MTPYREQAIRDVATAIAGNLGVSAMTVYIKAILEMPDGEWSEYHAVVAYVVSRQERVLELEAQSSTAAAKALELGAQWLRHEGFDSAADSLLLIRPGEITGEDREWASRMVAKLEAQLQQKEGERG